MRKELIFDVEKIRNLIDRDLFDCQSEVFIFDDSFIPFDSDMYVCMIFNIQKVLEQEKFNLSKLPEDLFRNRLLLLLLAYNKSFELCDWYQLRGCGELILRFQNILKRLEGLLYKNLSSIENILKCI